MRRPSPGSPDARTSCRARTCAAGRTWPRHGAPPTGAPAAQPSVYNTRSKPRSRKPSAVLTIVSRKRYTANQACPNKDDARDTRAASTRSVQVVAGPELWPRCRARRDRRPSRSRPRPVERDLFVSVLDQAGRTGPRRWAPPDFVVREDGRAREVLRVRRATDPIDLALLIDNSQALRRPDQRPAEGPRGVRRRGWRATAQISP